MVFLENDPDGRGEDADEQQTPVAWVPLLIAAGITLISVIAIVVMLALG